MQATMTAWIVGDIHGCAEELAELLERLALAESDVLVAVGDLFHRGPDPAGVLQLLRAARARFVLGNHELAMLRRAGLEPQNGRAAAAADPAAAAELCLDGDGGTPLCAGREHNAALIDFLGTHAGFYLRAADVGAGPTPDCRGWCVVHAGLVPGRALEEQSPAALTRLRRLEGPGRPYWYERYVGPELVLFGHTPSRLPRATFAGGRLVALGLDTGCVYGGALTAYAPERDAFASVPAARRYALA